jgi:ABC-2 type transport system permease protein
MILLIAISFFLVSSFSSTITTVQQPNTEVLSWYDNSGTYHFLAFETNQFGQAVSGATIQANLTSPFFSQNTMPLYQGPSTTTNSTGEAEFTIRVPASDINEVNANYTVVFNIYEANGNYYTAGGQIGVYSPLTSFSNGSSIPVPASPGQIIMVANSNFNGGGNGAISLVTESSNSQAENLMVTWAGPNGSLPTSYSLYYEFFNETETCTSQNQFGATSCTSSFSQPSSLNESNMTFFSKLSTYEQVFSPPKLATNLGNASEIGLGLFASNGSEVLSPIYFQVSQLYPSAQSVTLSQADQLVSNFLTTIYSFFVPLVAIIGSYNLYGKDRVSGVLESVLVQPVSRRGLALSRFLATFTGMAIAIGISMAVVDGLVYYYAKAFISSTILLASAGAFCVELAAFIGIMMLLSRVFKSSGMLIGIGIGLFILFDFLWSIIILILLTVTRTGFESNGYIGYTVAAEFANPAQFISLVITYLTSQSSSVGLLSPTQYGITIPSLVATGVLWIALPLAGFLYLAVKRD